MDILLLFTQVCTITERSAESSRLPRIEDWPSYTRWLAHERCVRAVKDSYSAIITALDHIYSDSHEPEAFGIKKALCKKSTIAAIYLLDYVLPQVAKLSRALQTENL